MREGPARALVALVALAGSIGSTINDFSEVGNFSRAYDARFFHKLEAALPGLLDSVRKSKHQGRFGSRQVGAIDDASSTRVEGRLQERVLIQWLIS